MKPPALGFWCAHAEGMIEYNILYRSEDSIARNGWVTGFEFERNWWAYYPFNILFPT